MYFVEDDYIHEDDALIEMIYTYQKIASQLKDELVLCSTDYPYLYVEAENTRNFIGFKKHWRLINQSLCTYLISKQTLQKYWKYYEDMFLNNYDPYEKPLHELYKKINKFFSKEYKPYVIGKISENNKKVILNGSIDWLQ